MSTRPARLADVSRPDPAGLTALLILAGAGLSFGWLAYRGELDRFASATPDVVISLNLPGHSVASISAFPWPGPTTEPDRLAFAASPANPAALQPSGETRPPIIRQPTTAVANQPAKAPSQIVAAVPPAPPPAPSSAPSLPTPSAPAVASVAAASGSVEALNYPQLQPSNLISPEAPAWQRFARPFDINDPRPRIAIVVIGLGLLHSETAEAIDELPSEVTLSFSPYSHGLEGWIGEARSLGHEVMLDLPMIQSGQGIETAGADESNPQAVVSGIGESDNLRRLDWVLARGQDYVGVAGVDAGGISATASGLDPVLSDIGRHGLMFLGPAEPGGLDLPRAVADLSIDDRPDRDYIDGRLAELERRARQTGFAVGVALGYPVTIERLALWSRGLEQKNLALAPVSALVGQQALAMISYERRPYRPGVGVMLLNRQAEVLVGKRIDMPSDAWQMPQGGIDADETPEAAAWREMSEEIGTDKAALLAESRDWYFYDLPPDLADQIWRGRFRGQRQKWFAFRFLGKDRDIDITTHRPEFSDWKWAPMGELPSLIVPFKRRLYADLVSEFGHLAQAA